MYRYYSTDFDMSSVVYCRRGGDCMDLRSYSSALTLQRRRLQQLVELDGGFDPDDPLQAFSLRRIAWLENRIEEEKRERTQNKRAAP